ncbi:MAG: hypothetical protein V1916_00865, partial [Patescibacteria group bacterium]
FNGSGGTWRPATSTLTVANNLNVTVGTMDNETNDRILDVAGDVTIGGTGVLQASSTASFTVGAGWTNAGTFTANSGTVTLDAGSGTRAINSTGAASASFNNLTLNDGGGPTTFQLGSALDVNGNLLITGGTLDTKSGSNWGITIAGNWTNSDTFTAQSGLVTADGTGQQTFGGTLTGSTGKFYDLTVTNAGASNPDVILGAAAEVARNFTAATASTQLQFTAGSTYTFLNISFNGQAAGTRVALRSSTPGTQWNLTTNGTRSVLNTDVQDSDACASSTTIDATGGTNVDSTNNECWAFHALSVSLTPNSINLGNLSATLVSQDGVVLTVSTDAASGYTSTVYYGGTMSSGGGQTIADTTGGTIPASSEEFGVATSKSGYTVTQWSPTSCADTASTSNATALSASTPKTFAGSTGLVTGDQTTLCFLASITGTTAAGDYSSIVTVVTTGLY